MSAEARLDEESLALLRSELKEWERQFAKKNGGRKASREDIKADATIAAKYKEYANLQRKSLESNTPTRKRPAKRGVESEREVLKDKPANVISATPKRDSKQKRSEQLLQLPPVVEEEPTPACVRFALGPTPQKDGEVLGIFDVLPAGTPSKGSHEAAVIPDLAITATPSKHTTSSLENKPSRTPQSSGKRFFLGAFAGTPLKRKHEEEHETPSTAKRQFATPSFLRRNVPLARIDEEDGDAGITARPFQKRGLVRSLSSIIQGLRKVEEEKLDEEWDIMREIEEEEAGIPGPSAVPKVLVQDSQAIEMPLGPDQGPAVSDDEGEPDPGSLDANGNPRKVWKKKGQKRQTKRVKMRPVTNKPKKAADARSEVVEESQNLDGPAERKEDQASDAEFDEEGEHSDFDDDGERPSANKASKKKPAKQTKAKVQTEDDSKDNQARKPKKVAAQAHANFRKLKIKNKNSKANGRGGRFGRR